MIKRVVYIGSEVNLSTHLGRLKLLNLETGEEALIPIDDIGVVEIDHYAINISNRLIRELMKANVVIMFNDEQHLPCGIAVPLKGYHAQTKRIIAQAETKLTKKKNLWQQIIKSKISNQATLLQIHGKDNIDLERISLKVKTGDKDNREAVASKIYWKRLFDSEFKRDQDGEYPNNMLNYGYIVLRSMMARAIVSAGLNPSLGIFHRNQYNPFCLADDMLEPFRVYVEKRVVEKYQQFEPTFILDKTHKKFLLETIYDDCVIEKEKHPLMIGMQIACNSLVKCYLGEDSLLKLPKFEV